MKKQIIGGLQVSVTKHGSRGTAYGLNNATLEQVETLQVNLLNEYNSVENHFANPIGGFLNWNGYFLCK